METKASHQTLEDIKNLIRVGDNYYEMIRKPNIRTDGFETVLVPRQKGTIIDDFGRKSLKMIKKFKAFVNKPSHTNYRRQKFTFQNISLWKRSESYARLCRPL